MFPALPSNNMADILDADSELYCQCLSEADYARFVSGTNLKHGFGCKYRIARSFARAETRKTSPQFSHCSSVGRATVS